MSKEPKKQVGSTQYFDSSHYSEISIQGWQISNKSKDTLLSILVAIQLAQ